MRAGRRMPPGKWRRRRRSRVRRGDVVTVALPGDYGKPRPALLIQSDLFDEHPSLTGLPITSQLGDAPLLRIAIAPEAGLDRASQIQIDNARPPRSSRCGPVMARAAGAGLGAGTRERAVLL